MSNAPVPVMDRFSDDQKNEIRNLYANGKTQEEIANVFGVPRKTIMKLCIKIGLHKDHRECQKSKFNDKFKEDVLMLRSNGKSINGISELLHRSTSAVHRVIQKCGDNMPSSSIDEKSICDDYVNNMNMLKIAKKYNISTCCVKKTLLKNNVKIRSPLLTCDRSKIRIESIILDPFVNSKDWWNDAYLKYGMSSIAKFLNKSVGYVSHNLRKHNIKILSISESLSTVDHTETLRLYKELGSMSKVAKRLNCSITSVRNILDKHGIQPASVSEMFSGSGNPFYGKEHPDDVKVKCIEIGSEFGSKFWQNHPEYVEIVKEKQKLIWSDVEKRHQQSLLTSKLRMEGRCNSKRGKIITKWGEMNFDSSYELKFIEKCEKSDDIILLERDFMLIEYEHNGIRNFNPDFKIWLKNGEFIIVEIKSDWLSMRPNEQAKIKSGFGVLLDKFMVSSDNFDMVFDRIKMAMSPMDFSFDDIIIREIADSDEYTDFYAAFHYMRRTGRKGYTLGAYLNEKLIAASTISSITRIEMAEKHNLESSQVRELVRFCIHPDFHKKNFASWFLSRVVNQYSKFNQEIKLLISFADSTQHIGTIYSASNWTYDGDTSPSYHYEDKNNNIIHKKTVYDRAKAIGSDELAHAANNQYKKIIEQPKHRYIIRINS